MNILGGILLLVVLSQVSGKEVFVKPGLTGSGDGTRENPYTFTNWSTAVASNDTVTLLPGYYNNTITLVIVNSKGGLVIRSSGGATVLYSLRFNNCTNVVISNIDFRPAPTGSPSITVGNGSSVSVDHCTFTDTVAFTSLTFATTALIITDSKFTGRASDRFISFAGSLIVRNCLFYNSSNSGISATGSLTVESTTFARIAAPLIDHSGAPLVLNNNNFYNDVNSAYLKCTTDTVTASGNSFCGIFAKATSCIALTNTPIITSSYDSCGVCNGDFSERDCSGVCFGTAVNCTVQSKKIWVANNGIGNGTSVDFALPNIQSALAVSNRGDTIILAPGIYTGTSNAGLYIEKAVTITSQYGSAEDVTILGNTAGSVAVQIQRGESFDTVFQSITLTGVSFGANIRANSAATFRDVTFTSTRNAVRLIDSFARFYDCRFMNNKGTSSGSAIWSSITFGQDSGAGFVVENSVFKSNSGNNGGAIYVGEYNSISIKNSVFVSNENPAGQAGASGGFAYFRQPVLALLNNNSFFNSTPNTAACDDSSNIKSSSNSFCGNIGGDSCNFAGAPIEVDYCGQCGGKNQSMDCASQCFGYHKTDAWNGCCFPRERDCAGRCPDPLTKKPFNKPDFENFCCPVGEIDRCGYCRGNNTKCCPEPCSEHGDCVLANPSYCNCTDGYFGTTCYDFACSPTCKNGGNCTEPNICNCDGTNRTGPTCDAIPCGFKTCNNGASCSGVTCNCVNGYYGELCNDFNCTTPCARGECVGPNLCRCTGTGFKGPLCEIPECVQPCQNNGTCLGSNACKCVGEWLGALCEVEPTKTSAPPVSTNIPIPYYPPSKAKGTDTKLIIILVPILAFLVLLAIIIILAVLLTRKRKTKVKKEKIALESPDK